MTHEGAVSMAGVWKRMARSVGQELSAWQSVPHWQDARHWQIGFLSLFLLLGFTTRAWALSPLVIAVAVAASLLAQFLAQFLAQYLCQALSALAQHPLPPRPFNWRSPLITSLGLCLLLRVDSWVTMAIAAVAAIASKFLLCWPTPLSQLSQVAPSQQKHFFNPANFGIITALLLTSDARISPGQWGEEFWYGALFLALGGLVLRRVGRWDTTVAFLGFYAGLEAGRNLWLGWTGDVLLHRLSSGSLLLFALFMVTDPRSIPNAAGARVVWAGAIALLTFVLRNVYFQADAVFWALFALAPLTPLLDRLFPQDRFEWHLPRFSSGEINPSVEVQS